MLRAKVIVVTALCSCIIFGFVVGSYATTYEPNEIFYFRPTTSTIYATAEGGGTSYPLTITSNGNWTDAQTGLFVGATYNGSGDNFVNHETFKLVMTFSAGATTSISNPEASYLFGLPSSPAPGMFNWKDRVESTIRPTATGSGTSAFTITFDNIPWSFVSGVSTVGILIPKSVMSVSGAIILLNCYLDLTSEYDEEAYQREVNERLERIGESLDDVKDSLDGIQDTLDNQLDEELNMNESASNKAKGDAEGALASLGNYAESYGNLFQQFLTLCLSDETLTEIPLPSGLVSIGDTELDIWAGAKGVDIQPWLDNPEIKTMLTIFRCVSTVAVICSCIYWAHQVKEWITNLDAVAVPKLPFDLSDFSGMEGSGKSAKFRYRPHNYEDE